MVNGIAKFKEYFKAIGVQATNKDELISLLHQWYGLRK